jgi:hypothetical protein
VDFLGHMSNFIVVQLFTNNTIKCSKDYFSIFGIRKMNQYIFLISLQLSLKNFGTKIFDLIVSSRRGMNVEGRNPNLSAEVISKHDVGRDCTERRRRTGLGGAEVADGPIRGGDDGDGSWAGRRGRRRRPELTSGSGYDNK